MISELVNAAKDMVIAATATQMPLSAGDVCAVGCEPRSGFRATLDIYATNSLSALLPPVQSPTLVASRFRFSRVLHDEISMRSFDSIFVGTVIDHDVPATKIVKWRRRCGRPFQRSSLPRILWCGRTLEPAVNQVVEKDQLRRTSNKCPDADELVQRQQRLQVIVYEGGITADVSGKTQKMKRHEDTVD